MKMLKSHLVAIGFSIVVGIICIAPQLFALKDSVYSGIQMFGTDAEYDYIARINQSRYDDYSGGLFHADLEKDYYLNPMLLERSVAFIGKAVHRSAVEVNVASKFIFPAVLFLLLYAYFLEMFASKKVAIIAPLFIILGPNLLNPKDAIGLFSFRTGIDSFLPYTRPINPQISSIFLFACLWAIYRCGIKKTNAWFAVLFGFIAGALLYSYVYSWAFVTVFIAVYGLHFFIRQDWGRVKLMTIALAVNAITAVPFFANLIKAQSDADYIETTARIGLAHSHTPIIGWLIIAGYFALLFLWPKDYLNDAKRYLLYVFTALVIVLNQQVITGVILQPGHFHWYIAKPFLILVIVFLALYWVRKFTSKRGEIIMSALFAFFILLSACVVQVHSYRANYETFHNNQKYASVLSLLNLQYGQRKTIWADQDLSLLITAYTPHRAPNTLHSPYYVHSREYLQSMLFLENRISSSFAQRIDNFSENGLEYIVGRIFGMNIDAELRNLSEAYGDFEHIPLNNAFRKVGVDLVIIENGTTRVDFNKDSSLIKDGEIGQFTLYHLK